MVFPFVEATATSQEFIEPTNDSTIHAAVLPSGIVSGDLILIIAATDGNSGLNASGNGYTLLNEVVDQNNAVSLTVHYRWANGTEHSVVDFTTPSAQRFTQVSYRISGATNPSPIVGNSLTSSIDASGEGINPNANVCRPVGGVKDYLWITIAGVDGRRRLVSSPASYGNTIVVVGNSTRSTSTLVASRKDAISSENSGSFEINLRDQWTALTLAVHPAVSEITTMKSIEVINAPIAAMSLTVKRVQKNVHQKITMAVTRMLRL